jgi:lipopolysaccharide export system permease protein
MPVARILQSYVLRETVQTWLATIVVLLVILVTYQFTEVLGDAASAKMPRDEVFRVLGLTSLQLLAVLTPISLFLAILLALGRLYRDSEMAALMACGIGPARLYRSLLGFALLLAAAVAWLAIAVAPAATRTIQAMAAAAQASVGLDMLEAGRFVSLGDTGAVLFAGRVNADGSLADVFVQRRQADKLELIIARRAWEGEPGPDGQRVLRFADGRRYEGKAGSPRFRVMRFAEHGIPYELPTFGPPVRGPEAMTLAELWGSESLEDQAELQWRFSSPLILLMLTLLAVPLSRSGPRQGRYTGVMAGVLVYLIYVNMLSVARVWVERGDVDPRIGIWWVHLACGAAGLLMVAYQHGWPRRALAR